MAKNDFLESDKVYFDYKKWSFRTLRRKLDDTCVIMSYPCNYWDDSITTICEETIPLHVFNEMYHVFNPMRFPLCRWTSYTSECSDGAIKAIPLKNIVERYIALHLIMKD